MVTTRILVSGAAGFLGYHLAETLSRDADIRVICVDNFIRGERDDLYEALIARPNVEGFDLDLADQEAVRRLPDEVDVIYHMAALNGTQNFYERPFDVLKCCTLPTFHLLDKYGPGGDVRRFVYAGSSEAYGATVTKFQWEVPTTEDVPLGIDNIFNPRWSYGASKLHGEILTVNACRYFDMSFTIIRYHNAYGPRMGDKHVVPDFLNRIKHGIFALYGYEDTRSFIYVDDAIETTIRVADSDKTVNEVLNVGGSQEIKILDLAHLIMDVANIRGEIELHPSPEGSVKRRAPSLKKLRELTGFEEKWSLRDGLTVTADYYLSR